MRIHVCIALLGIFATTATLATAATEKRPNILIFLSDDVGWAEYGFQGNKDIPTPNIDSIAKNGVRFTQGYVAATYCSPSRAGLMTGRYPTRTGVPNGVFVGTFTSAGAAADRAFHLAVFC